jgi:hypothetical protein
MELLIGIVIIGVVLFFVFGFGAKAGVNVAKDGPNFASRDVRTAQVHDCNNLLNAYRREIANVLVWRDPDRYLDFYRTLHTEVSTYKDWKIDALQAKHDELAKKYPQYADFDGFGTRLHVLYTDTHGGWSDDLAARFADITRFQALAFASYWKSDAIWLGGATSDDDLAHFTEYVPRIKDTKFALRLERAVDDYRVWCEGKGGRPHWDSPIEEQTFDTYTVTVRPISHFAENRYGVHFKDTNEFGLNTFYVFDDGRISYSHYRTDATFQNQHRLDHLRSVADAYRESLRPQRSEESVNGQE